jgi:putative transcriptional regulator
VTSGLHGTLLIASPALTDPNFHRAVVLIAEHSPDGAMGLILNRPLHITVEEAVPPLAALVTADEPVHEGGPVQPESVLVLGDFVDPSQAPAVAFGSVGFLPGGEDLPLPGDTLRRARVFAGYAGWGAGQLEGELEEQAWFTIPAAVDDCFTDDPERLWRRALRRRGGHAAMLALLPDDPTRN